MKILAAVLAGSGVLAAVAVGTGPGSDTEKENTGTAVVTFGPVEMPMLPPRVRVANDRFEAVDIWYVTVDSDELHRLGWVSPAVTQTFVIPAGSEAVRILVQPRASRGLFLTEDIPVDFGTDVSLQVTQRIDQTIVEVEHLQVMRMR